MRSNSTPQPPRCRGDRWPPASQSAVARRVRLGATRAAAERSSSRCSAPCGARTRARRGPRLYAATPVHQRGVAGGVTFSGPPRRCAGPPSGRSPDAVGTPSRQARRLQIALPQVRRQTDAAHQQVAVGVARTAIGAAGQCGDAIRPCCFGQRRARRACSAATLGEIALALSASRLPPAITLRRHATCAIDPHACRRAASPPPRITATAAWLPACGVSQRLCFSLRSQPKPLCGFDQCSVRYALRSSRVTATSCRGSILVLLQTLPGGSSRCAVALRSAHDARPAPTSDAGSRRRH